MLKTMTPYPTDDESLARDTDIEFIRDSGPGGQHRNKVETGGGGCATAPRAWW